MRCPKCNGKTKVIDSREIDGKVIRTRICLECKKRFYSLEGEVEYTLGIEYARRGWNEQYNGHYRSRYK